MKVREGYVKEHLKGNNEDDTRCGDFLACLTYIYIYIYIYIYTHLVYFGEVTRRHGK